MQQDGNFNNSSVDVIIPSIGDNKNLVCSRFTFYSEPTANFLNTHLSADKA